jgi:hypothetical protein
MPLNKLSLDKDAIGPPPGVGGGGGSSSQYDIDVHAVLSASKSEDQIVAVFEAEPWTKLEIDSATCGAFDANGSVPRRLTVKAWNGKTGEQAQFVTCARILSPSSGTDDTVEKDIGTVALRPPPNYSSGTVEYFIVAQGSQAV